MISASNTVIVPAREAFHADTRPVQLRSIGASRLRYFDLK